MDSIIKKLIQLKLEDKLNKTKKYISSKQQTKLWRKKQKWYINGKYNECEKQQILIIEKMICCKIQKTDIRINLDSLEMKSHSNPLNYIDGFEWTEDFDGLVKKDGIKYYFNFKMICDNGGSQTRTLREVYHFIKAQHKLTEKIKNIVFINILEGDCSYKHRHKFNKFKKNNLFIGDILEFSKTPILK